MNSFELVPTEENLIQALRKDLLKRNQDLVRFYDLLLAQEGACSIAIDGRWGSGKTFFVKQSMLLINAKNPMCSMNKEQKDNIISSLPFSPITEDVSENYDLAVYYDAWENDNDSDPVLSLVYEIAKQTGLNYALEEDCNIFKLAGSVLETFKGKNINSIIENLKSEKPLDKLHKDKELHENIKQFFTEVLAERGNRLVVFVDELDRCKPNYAVQLLERIKHYLGDDRIIFVFSVNLDELQHTIKHYYGDSFDSCRYLDRFFDIRISLPSADKTAFYNEIGLDSHYILEKVCQRIISTYNMELREVIRFYRQVKTAVYEPTHDSKKWDFSFSEGRGKQILMAYVVPILVGLKIVDISLYNDFINGKNSKPLMDVYDNSDVGEGLVTRLLNRGESLVDADDSKKITLKQKLSQLYEAIYIKEYIGREYHTILGECEFNEKSKYLVEGIAGLLSSYADYEI